MCGGQALHGSPGPVQDARPGGGGLGLHFHGLLSLLQLLLAGSVAVEAIAQLAEGLLLSELAAVLVAVFQLHAEIIGRWIVPAEVLRSAGQLAAFLQLARAFQLPEFKKKGGKQVNSKLLTYYYSRIIQSTTPQSNNIYIITIQMIILSN